MPGNRRGRRLEDASASNGSSIDSSVARTNRAPPRRGSRERRWEPSEESVVGGESRDEGQAAGTAAKAATGNLGKVAAGQAGKSAATGAAGKAAALSGAVAQIPTLGVEGEAASGVVDAVASLIGDGGASATSAAGAGKAAGGGTAAAGKAASAAAAGGEKRR